MRSFGSGVAQTLLSVTFEGEYRQECLCYLEGGSKPDELTILAF